MEITTDLKRLILYFDINKTILMKDSARYGSNVDAVLILLISTEAWGHYDEDSGSWKLATRNLYEKKPSVED